MKMRLKNYNKPLSLSIFLSPFVIFAQNATEEYHTIKEKYNAKEFDYKIEETKPGKELDLEWLRLYNLCWLYDNNEYNYKGLCDVESDVYSRARYNNW